MEGISKMGAFSTKTCIQKGKGLDLGAEPPREKLCWVPSPRISWKV